MGNLQIANSQKNKLYIGLGFLGVFVLLTIAVAPMILASISDTPKQTSTDNYFDISEKDFPLEADLGKKAFSLGEKISFNATITNKSGKDVNVSSNGEMPCVFFHKINDTTTHGETTRRVDQILKANDRISRVFEYETSETGTNILDVHYRIDVNSVAIHDRIDDI